ncbi:hypothetical protein [Nocardia jinanensis]|uniref:Uncharacterized protein n=1 Tax=Nocardia jinanensis TaxID=382504 RepID=A0A917RSM5_9NOCA|nr:hypothetical protein [Nocardia jinanensis]GGL24317.1 hypothetical protein GCM10011588_43890 [Nocardia jinanensis]
MTDDRMADIYAAVRLGGANREAARQSLQLLWDQLGTGGEPLSRSVVAHHLADVQDTAEDALLWDTRALDAAFVPGIPLGEGLLGFLPSLYLSLADSHRLVGDFDAARMQLALARGHANILADDAYGQVIRAGVDHVAVLLEAQSTERVAC